MQEIPYTTLQKAAEGNKQAFEQIYNMASGFVYTVAYRVVNNREKACDVTQEVFLKIYTHLKSFQFRSSFKTWLYRITVNTAITAAQRYQKYSKRVIGYDDVIGYRAGAETTNHSYATTENREHLQRLLERLNPEQRACIILREIEGLSYKEIADALNTNINTVRTRLLRARQVLMRLGRKEVIGNDV